MVAHIEAMASTNQCINVAANLLVGMAFDNLLYGGARIRSVARLVFDIAGHDSVWMRLYTATNLGVLEMLQRASGVCYLLSSHLASGVWHLASSLAHC